MASPMHGQELGQTPGDVQGQGSLACCSPWGCKESDTTGQQHIAVWSSAQFSSVIQSCSTLCDPMDCSIPGLPGHHQLPELAQTHIHQVDDAIQLSHPLSSPSPAFNLSPASGSFPVSQFFTSGGQSIGATASALVLPVSIHD